jgi:hypothetical protein
LAQLRHMRAAERSGKGPVEDEQDVLHPAEVGQTDDLALIVGQAEVGCALVEGYTWHCDAPALKIATSYEDFAVLVNNARQAPVAHSAQSTSTGWKTRRTKRA